MHTNWCVLIEILMEIGMLNFWLGLLVTAQTKENYFSSVKKVWRFRHILTVLMFFFSSFKNPFFFVVFLEYMNFKTVKSWPIPSRQASHCWLKARRRKYVIWINIAHREQSTLCTGQSCVLLRSGLGTIFFDEVLRKVADKDLIFQNRWNFSIFIQKHVGSIMYDIVFSLLALILKLYFV